MRRPQKIHVVAGGLGLAQLVPLATLGFELGDASMTSGLGQSLRVEIPYRLAPSETLTPACVRLVPARDAGALPAITQASRISVTATHIEIFDGQPVREPLIGLNVDIRCGTVPRFMRSYQLLVDLPTQLPATLATRREPQPIAAAAPSRLPDVARRVIGEPITSSSRVAAASVSAASAPRAAASPRARGDAGGDLAQGQTYTVVRGDTLSGIAARVTDRPGTIRDTAEAIFAANPGAFSRGNRDLLQEGRSLTIPTFTASDTARPGAASVVQPEGADVGSPVAATAPADSAAQSATPTLPAAAAAPTETAADVVAERPTGETSASAPPAPPITVPDGADTLDEQSPQFGTSTWLAALLSLGVVMLVAMPVAFVLRRRQRAEPAKSERPRESARRRGNEAASGIEVVEGRLPSAPNSSAELPAVVANPASAATTDEIGDATGSSATVDLDVGAPVAADPSVDWFAEQADTVAVEAVAPGEEQNGASEATARMPDPIAANAAEPPRAAHIDIERTLDDEQMTLTIVELDLLRQDYEAEHTLTQQSSEALRAAVADLAATKAARDSSAETATLEMPREPAADSVGDIRPSRRVKAN